MDKEDVIQSRISKLFINTFSCSPTKIKLLTSAGSPRKYYRIFSSLEQTIIACLGTNLDENKTFLYYCNHFFNKGIAVPKVYAQEDEPWLYLIEDCGATDLLTTKENFNESEVLSWYKQVLQELIQIQIEGSKGLDFSKSFVRPEFDETYMKWDLYYFKYYYLKLTGIEFNEQKLEEDFDNLIAYLRKADFSFFMYRDFQSRNILVNNNKNYYIDFQGGMKGPLHYDLVSLLHQAKAMLPQNIKDELLQFYIEEAGKKVSLNKAEFASQYEGFALIRILQTLGAYGFRGIIEGKPHFISSIPAAVENVKNQVLLAEKHIKLPYLYSILKQLPIIQTPAK